MTIDLTCRGISRKERLGRFVEQRVQVALRRFNHRVRHIMVRIKDVNAGKGGVDKVCQIDAQLHPHGVIHVEANSDEVHAAIAQAAERASRAVAKRIGRSIRGRSVRHRGRTAVLE